MTFKQHSPYFLPPLSALFWAYLYFAFFTFSTGVLQLIYCPSQFSAADLGMVMFLDVLFLLPLVLFPHILRLLWLVFLYPLLLTLGLGNLIHILVYRSTLSSFAIHSIIETTAGESVEFLTANTSIFKAVLVVSAGALPLIFMLWAVRALRKGRKADASPKNRLGAAVFVLLCSITGAVLAMQDGRDIANVHGLRNFYTAVLEYHKNLISLVQYRDEAAQHDFAGLRLLDAGRAEPKPRTYIFIIGESANRQHMSLYGYARETTPWLSAMRDELLVFENVISGATHTIPSLRKILLFPEKKDTESGPFLSMINLFNAAGFKTFWLSNQIVRPEGLSGTSIIAGDCSRVCYVNMDLSEKQTVSVDGLLLPELDKALADPSYNKVIFLHLLGSHTRYALRYPADWQHFRDTTDIPQRSWYEDEDENFILEARETINAYDNSIRYNDFVVTEVIRRMQVRDERSFVLYFSDHGQEVYETLPMRGQVQENPTKNMLTVPFIMWLSPSYKAANPYFANSLQNYTDRPFVLDQFVYSAAELARISFADMNNERNLFASEFKAAPHLAPNGALFESLK